mgnify:CR=1 FL=1
MQEVEVKTEHDELIARIIDNEDVYMYTSVLRKDEAIALAKKILDVFKDEKIEDQLKRIFEDLTTELKTEEQKND